MSSGRSSWIAVSCFVGMLGAARPAEACSPPPTGWFGYGVQPAPANGVVIVRYGCSYGCDPAPDPESFSLQSADGEEVPGEIALSGSDGNNRYVVFRPEDGMLLEGESYTPVLPGVDYLSAFSAKPPVTFRTTLPVTHEVFALDNVAGERVCCSGPLDSCGGTPCFHTAYERSAVVRITWGDGASDEDLQYAFRFVEAGPVPAWTYADFTTSYVLDDDETTTCYSLELLRLVDDTVISVGERCVDRPEDIVPGTYVTSDEVIEGTLAGCDAPPEAYEEPWCRVMEERCQTQMIEAVCTRFEQHCPTLGAGGSSGAAGSGGSTGGDGAQGGSSTGSGGTASSTGGDSGTGNGGSEPGGRAGTSATTGGASGSTPLGSGGDAGAPDGAAGDANAEGSRTVLTKGGCGCGVPARRASLDASLLSLLALGWFARRRVSARCR
jgi:hypothetical protein